MFLGTSSGSERPLDVRMREIIALEKEWKPEFCCNAIAHAVTKIQPRAVAGATPEPLERVGSLAGDPAIDWMDFSPEYSDNVSIHPRDPARSLVAITNSR